MRKSTVSVSKIFDSILVHSFNQTVLMTVTYLLCSSEGKSLEKSFGQGRQPSGPINTNRTFHVGHGSMGIFRRVSNAVYSKSSQNSIFLLIVLCKKDIKEPSFLSVSLLDCYGFVDCRSLPPLEGL